MKTLFNAILIVSMAFQEIVGFGSQNIAKVQAAGLANSAAVAFAGAVKAEPVPLLSDTLKDQQTSTADTTPVEVSLKADPQLIIPGVPVSVQWSVDGWSTAQKRGNLQTVVHFPNAMKTNGISASLTKGIDTTAMNLRMTASTGSTSLNSDAITDFSYLIDVDVNSGTDQLATNSILMTKPTLEAVAGIDNHLVSKDGRVTLDFPASTLSESLYMDVRDPSPSNIHGYSLSGNPLEVVAVGETSKKNVNKFNGNYTISMNYDPAKIYGGGSEDDLSIYYYDEATNDWWPVATTVDTVNHKLTAQVNHLTVFDYQANNWQSAHLPTVDQAQVTGNTGAASYNMSFWLPPAQGGFGPSLSLSYNSQVIDSSTAFTEAGWVGMGWSLDTAYVERNMHGTDSDLTDDTYQLNLNGVSSTLLPISTSGTVTTYAAEAMNYWLIQYNSSTDAWTIKDQAGTTYIFGFQTKTNTTNGCVTSTGDLNLTWRWSLITATDKFSNVTTYAYVNKKKTSSTTCLNQVAVYPTTITYPNGHYQIAFVLGSRTDYQSAWEANDSRVFFQNKLLKSILVKQNPSGATWNTIRQYAFTYSSTTTNQIYPNFRWTKGGTTAGLTTTLVGVQELSGDGTTANLPATQFTYGDKMHLTKVDNSQGGSTAFNYERWTYLDDVNHDTWMLSTVFGTDECSSTLGTAWTAVSGYGTTKCEQNMLQVDEASDSVGLGERSFPQNLIKQGAEYRLYVEARDIYKTTSITFGFTNPGDHDYEVTLTGIGTTPAEKEGGVEMPVTLNPLKTKLKMECDDCYVQKLQILLMPLYYRVTSKTVTDSATSNTVSGTYTYSYNDGAVNDAAHSDTANITLTGSHKRYTKILTDYRGYSQVQVTNPDGLVTTTWYDQDDLQKGLPYRTLTSTMNVSDEFNSLDTTKWTFSHPNVRQTLAGVGLNESALESVSSTADWTTVTNRSAYSLTDGDVMFTQFRVSGANTQAQLGMENSSGDFFGIYAVPNGSSHDLKTRVKVNGTTTDSMLMSASTFKRNTLYEAMIFVDANDGFHLRVWKKGDPTNYVESSSSSPNGAAAWRFTDKVYNGTVFLDSYFEGVPYSETETAYNASTLYNTLSDKIPNLSSLTNFVDLQVNWSPVSSVISRLFDGDYSWSGTKTTYDYNTADQGSAQYGNLTRTTQSYWNGSAWVDYRAKLTQFYPNATSALTTLPAREVSLDCASGCDFTTATGKLAETLYLYDNASAATTSPSVGKLAATRTWVDRQ